MYKHSDEFFFNVIRLSRLHENKISQMIGQSTCLNPFSWQKVKNYEKKNNRSVFIGENVIFCVGGGL